MLILVKAAFSPLAATEVVSEASTITHEKWLGFAILFGLLFIITHYYKCPGLYCFKLDIQRLACLSASENIELDVHVIASILEFLIEIVVYVGDVIDFRFLLAN